MAILSASRLTDGGGPSKFIPVAIVVTKSGERIEIDSNGKSASGGTPVGSTKPLPSNTAFTPVATIITQNGEEIEVDASGKSADGSVPVGSTKKVAGAGKELPVGSTFTATDGKVFTDEAAFSTYQASLNTQATAAATAKQEADAAAEKKRREGQSAYSLLFSQFDQNGLGALVEPLKQFIQDGLSEAEFTLRLRETDAYKKRFAANAQRVAKGLRSLSEAEYVGMEDQYQNVMRQYGLPESYYSRGEMGKQEGFEKFIAGDVSAVELEDRISTAQKRVLNANPEVTQALKQFYPDITNADILAYTLDPKNAIENIKRKVTAAEIGGAAMSQTDAMGKPILTTSEARARELAGYGVDKAAATEGYSAIGGGLQRGSQLAAIYGQSPYTQTTAEAEVFKLSGQQEARKQRQKVTGLEKATFGGQSGVTGGALARDRAGAY